MGDIPKRFRGLAFDRAPVKDMDSELLRHVRRYCNRIEEHLAAGTGLGFWGPKGTGKTTMAMLISTQALGKSQTVAIYSLPRLLAEIRKTYDSESGDTYLGLMERLAMVDLLHLEDLAVARQTDWTLEQLYSVINRRYEDERAILFTADVMRPMDLGTHIGDRTFSRLAEMSQELIPMFGDDHRFSAREASSGGGDTQAP